MANSLFPAFVKLYYHTLFGSHVRTIPTKEWVGDANPQGSFVCWDATVQDADVMIKVLANLEKVVLPSTTVLDYYDIWSYPDADSLPFPVATNSLSITGTGGGTGWAEAVEETLVFRTEGFSIFKYVFLDIPTDNFFGKVAPVDLDVNFQAICDELMDISNAWAGRDNTKPNIVKQATITLNEKLRRSYHLT